MVLVENYTLAVLLCVLAMICWGSWQNTQNLAGKNWRFELYYWDFIIGIFLFSIFMAFTFGSFGSSGRPFLSDLRQADPSNLLSAAIGGAIWNLGTLLLIAAISIAGMSVAFPIGGGIGWILGIVINYMGKPEGNPWFLFGGSAVIVLAIIFSMISYRKLASAQHKAPLKGILLSFAAGILIAFFYRFVASALDTTFTPQESGKITSYTAVVLFSIGAIVSTLLFNPVFMRKPVQPDKLLETVQRALDHAHRATEELHRRDADVLALDHMGGRAHQPRNSLGPAHEPLVGRDFARHTPRPVDRLDTLPEPHVRD